MEKRQRIKGGAAHLQSPREAVTVCGRDSLTVRALSVPLFEQEAAIGKACNTCTRIFDSRKEAQP